MENRKIFLNISKNDSSPTKTITLSENLIRLFLIVAVALIFIFIASFYFVSKNTYKLVKFEMVNRENDLLKDKIIQVNSELQSIKSKIKKMEDWEDKFREANNFKLIDKALRKQGMGGLPQIDSSFTKYDSSFSVVYNKVQKDIKSSKAKLEFDLKTHRELSQLIEKKIDMFDHTPSIYPAFGRITETYGWRTHPITKRRNFHCGIDIGNKRGTPIYATADGKVIETGRKKYFGYYISIKHKYDYQTNYAHLNKILIKEGEQVKKGQMIALMGNSGLSTGPHLHYEVYKNYRHKNPYKYFDKQLTDIKLN